MEMQTEMERIHQLLSTLEEFVNEPRHRAVIEQACDDCEAELRDQPGLDMTWRAAIPELRLTGAASSLRSLWVFAFAPNGESDIHRHSNSTQYTRVWRGRGRLMIGEPERAAAALSPQSKPEEPDQPWTVIPPGVFHQAIADAEGWCVVSFQTVPAAELRDEPDEGEARPYLAE